MPEIFIPTEDRFKEIIEQTVTSILETKLPEVLRRAKKKPWLTNEEAQEFLGLSGRKLQYLRSKKRIPYSQSGRKIFYKTADLEEWLQKNMPERWDDIMDPVITTDRY